MASPLEKSRPLVPWFVLLISLISTGLVSAFLSRSAHEKDKNRFDGEVERAVSDLEDRINVYIGILRAEAGFFAATDSVSPAEFKSFVDRIGVMRNYPGVMGMGYSEWLLPEDLPNFLDRARADVNPNFTVWPEGARAAYTSILYLEPQNEINARALGFDMFTERVRRDAMSRARDNGEPAASGRVVLVQDIVHASNEPGFLIYVPVYNGVEVPPTVEERRAKLRGFAYTPFRASDFLEAVYEEARPQLEVRLHDGEFADHSSLLGQFGAVGAGYHPRFHDQKTVNVGGRPWTLILSSRPEFERISGRYVGWYFFAVGSMVSVFLFGLSWRQVQLTVEAVQAAANLENSERRIKFLADVSESLAGSLDFQTTLRAVSDLIVERMADWSAIDLIAETGDRLERVLLAHKDSDARDQIQALVDEFPWSPSESVGVWRVIRTGRPVYIGEMTDELLRARARSEEEFKRTKAFGIRSAMITPMTVLDKPIGTITWFSTLPGRRYGREDLELAMEVSRRSAIAIQNSRLYAQAKEEIENRARVEEDLRVLNQNLERIVRERTRIAEERAAELKFLANELTQAEQRERKRLAQILHDDMQQILVAARLRIGSARPGPDYGERLTRAQELIGQAIQTARELSTQLAPPILSDRGLGPALEWLARKMRENHDMKIKVRAEPGAEPESYDLGAFLLQAAQEALLNVLKHAGTHEAAVELTRVDDGMICLTVSDEGKGCDPEDMLRMMSSDHFGLFNIKHRLELLGGKFDLLAGVGSGCAVRLTAPSGIGSISRNVNEERRDGVDSGDSAS